MVAHGSAANPQFKNMVRARGLEPPILAEPDPKSGVSAIPPRALADQHLTLIYIFKVSF